ncbi:hypothetical protein E1B28_012805 [Marasmius oreades]|uniref:Uncharacterized protein n=1 Tax=Marasmius oreades TaxID=181124 RepID=A0A9P7RTC9_9AGAR|nr:uncharacterized protein E1B28_012805 [Marasmius oreades]KAG7088851.1 hypothetical protein E1B28_012805 [Marasmius oreades]
MRSSFHTTSMSSIAAGPEAQDSLFTSDYSAIPVPDNLIRATNRLQFPPSYVVVGVYRLCTDRNLYAPTWQKCKHGTVRGAVVGTVWTFFTFGIQKKFIEVFLANSPRVAGLSGDTMFGYKVPFNIHTYAAILALSTQITFFLRFFLSRNIRIARDRVWDQTLLSRGKGPEFWKPYVEEWDNPPPVEVSEPWVEKMFGGWFGLFVVKKVLLAPLALYPFVGIVISAWFRGLGTAHALHRRYFEAKKMTREQIAVFMEERKWDYRLFGFTAALLEGIPIVGLVFTVSNRIGAAMWAHDLEKRQHYVASQKAVKL